MGFTWYRKKFSADVGETVDNYLASWLWFFVLMNSAENYTDIGYQGARYNKLSWIFFAIVTVVGVFLLLSMVLALFGSTWDKLQAEQLNKSASFERSVQAVYYTLAIWDQPPTESAKPNSLMLELGWNK